MVQLPSTLLAENRQWVEDTLERVHMVEWDRFAVGNHPETGRYIEVYGWIDRDDEYKDFCIIEFQPETDENLIGYTTSSDEYTNEIYRCLYDLEPDDHNDCRRVENHFDVSNSVELAASNSTEPAESVDGGSDE